MHPYILGATCTDPAPSGTSTPEVRVAVHSDAILSQHLSVLAIEGYPACPLDGRILIRHPPPPGRFARSAPSPGGR
ncbi:hypothetical protein SEA_SHOTGUN_54 [Microbacterium phage Shotgun]|uniref:Uncharacterized protein n=1 Tax=Microbacterium phage Shotgun TaxID=2863847 RepID=A0AAE7WXQ8_9CAUD|nr:hypothetical protein QDA06_gp54 [Microbacterium phage Shotgun]QYW07547.1 hypothetical protein SEA_SHOTGUN_54 [Microbacterium phage Shotgun]